MKKLLILAVLVGSFSLTANASCRYRQERHYRACENNRETRMDYRCEANGDFVKHNRFKGRIEEYCFDKKTGEQIYVQSEGTFCLDKKFFNQDKNDSDAYHHIYDGECVGYGADKNSVIFRRHYRRGKLIKD